MAFTFEHELINGLVYFKLNGDLIEKSQAQELLDQADEFISEDKRKFLIDLEGVKYMNSSGLNALISLLTKARKHGGEAVIANVSPKVKDLLIITRLNTVFTVTDNAEEAKKKLMEI